MIKGKLVMEKILIEKEVKIPGTNVVLENGDAIVLKESGLITNQYAQDLARRFSKGLDFLRDK